MRGSQNTLLSQLCKAVFDDTQYRECSLFRSDLREFRRRHRLVASVQDEPLITATALGLWFASGSTAGPARRTALRFLVAYCSDIIARKEDENTKGLTSDRLKLVQLALVRSAQDEFIKTIAGLPPKKIRTREQQHAQEPGDREHEKKFVSKLSAISGLYQVIRPSAANVSSYVLEPLEITATGRDTNIFMYSHNLPDKEFMYSGEIDLTTRYGFTLIKRNNDSDGGRSKNAYRELCLFYNFSRSSTSNDYISHQCISGLLIRGVRGEHTVGQPAVGMPFIAFRRLPLNQSECPHLLSNAEFQKEKDDLTSLLHDNNILCGEIAETLNPLYSFCQSLFESVTSKSREGVSKTFSLNLVMRTISPADLDAIIHHLAGRDSTFYDTWVNIVAEWRSM
jgi:hypothetical protein